MFDHDNFPARERVLAAMYMHVNNAVNANFQELRNLYLGPKFTIHSKKRQPIVFQTSECDQFIQTMYQRFVPISAASIFNSLVHGKLTVSNYGCSRSRFHLAKI